MVPDSSEVVLPEDIEDNMPPAGQGWWPVINLTLDLEQAGVTARGRWLLICFYQLLGEQLVAWWLGWDEDYHW